MCPLVLLDRQHRELAIKNGKVMVCGCYSVRGTEELENFVSILCVCVCVCVRARAVCVCVCGLSYETLVMFVGVSIWEEILKLK